MNGRLKVSLAVALLLCAGIVAWLVMRVPVDVARAEVGEAVDAVPAVVKIRPAYEITVAAEVEGRVLRSNVKLGQKVEKGQTLFEIDAAKLKIELDRITDQLQNLIEQFKLDLEEKISLERRKTDLANLERQFEQGQYSELEIKRRREDFKLFVESQAREKLSREQSIRELQTSLRLQQQLLDKSVITAPTSGTITEIFAHPGELVIDRAPVARLLSDEVVVEARINEEDFAGVAAGQTVLIRLLAFGDEQAAGRVVQVLPNADEQTQQYRAILSVDLPADRLLPGLSGEASIIRQRVAGSLLVPRQAVVNGHVFVIRDGVAGRLAVKTGLRDLRRVQITEGLKAGDIVAISGLDRLSDGTRVKINGRP